MISVFHYCSGTTNKINAELSFKTNKAHPQKETELLYSTWCRNYHNPRQILVNIKVLDMRIIFIFIHDFITVLTLVQFVLSKQLVYATVLDLNIRSWLSVCPQETQNLLRVNEHVKTILNIIHVVFKLWSNKVTERKK